MLRQSGGQLPAIDLIVLGRRVRNGARNKASLRQQRGHPINIRQRRSPCLPTPADPEKLLRGIRGRLWSAARRVSKLRDVLRLTAAGMSSRQAAANLTIRATTVIGYLGRAQRAGPLPDDLTDETLEPRL